MATLQEKSLGKAQSSGLKLSRSTSAINPHVIWAIARRDFLRFFFNPAGYVFITLFVIASAVLAFWQPVFFTRNLDNLDTLNGAMPYLLLFFIPAVTMSIWADERKQGTEELLLTLPATDLDVVLGKYLAALGIFSISLLFMFPHVLMLLYLGQPDLGVTFASFYGYWLMGAMLIAVGMVASLLSSNVTVAFILGAVLSAIPVAAGYMGMPAGAKLGRTIEELSIPAQFQDFGAGVISFSGLFYFLSATAGILYINIVLLGRRHWAGGEKSANRWGHIFTRVIAVIVAVASLNAMIGRTSVRADISEEQLHTLSSDSLTLLKQIPKDRPVYIQAYYSPEVPRDFVQTKTDLIGLLKEFASRGGESVRLNLVETELYSDDARKAEKQFGIQPRQVISRGDGRQEAQEILLGVAFSSGPEEVVIPFFDRGLPVEYELIRSIKVVSGAARRKVGVLGTDAKLMGGFDMRTMGQNPEWSIVSELKKQYDVSSVAPDSELPTNLDVLLVAQPSSLTQPQIDNLTAYVKRGGPALLFLDPMPIVNTQLAPEVPKQAPGGPFGGGPPPEQKGDLTALLEALGVEWPTTEIVWNPYNPLQQRPDMIPEIVFMGKGSGAEEPFNPKDKTVSGLQEIVALFPGLLRPRSGSGPEFIPLLQTSPDGGTISWSKLTVRGPFGGMSIDPDRPHFATGRPYTLAAHIKGEASTSTTPDLNSAKDSVKKVTPKPSNIHAVVIADLDLVSEEFFNLRRQKVEELELDNVTFVLNCVDVLAGDDSFVSLRKKRLKHRTLSRIESQSKQHIEKFQTETKAAEEEAKSSLDVAQKNLDKEVAALTARKDVDERTKEILAANLQEVANRRLAVQKLNIEDQKRRKIFDSKAETEVATRGIRDRVRWLALLLEPMPPIALGLVVFMLRIRRENFGATPSRLA